MDGDGESIKLFIKDIFRDFKRRRAGIIRALTTDYQEFRAKCDPEEFNLSLYGHPNKQWEVKVPNDAIPPDIPDPVLGINFARDDMPEKDWLALVAVRSDIWLLSVAYSVGARFDKAKRQQLFTMINELPTVYEVVTGKAKIHTEEKPNVSSSSGSNRKSNSRNSERAQKEEDKAKDEKNEGDKEDESKDEEAQEDESCGACLKKKGRGDFWICCGRCFVGYHGKCVNVTEFKAKSIDSYKCPSCSRFRLWFK